MDWDIKINSDGAETSIKSYEKNSEDTLNALKAYQTNLDDILGKGWKGTASEKCSAVISDYQESTLKFVDKINDCKCFMQQVISGFGDLKEKSDDVGRQMSAMSKDNAENAGMICEKYSNDSMLKFSLVETDRYLGGESLKAANYNSVKINNHSYSSEESKDILIHSENPSDVTAKKAHFVSKDEASYVKNSAKSNGQSEITHRYSENSSGNSEQLYKRPDFNIQDKTVSSNNTEDTAKVGIQTSNDSIRYASSADNFDKPKTASYNKSDSVMKSESLDEKFKKLLNDMESSTFVYKEEK